MPAIGVKNMEISRTNLERQADRLEALLRRHKVTGRVQGGVVTHRMIQFDLTVDPGHKVRQIQSLAEEMALALNVQTVRVYRQGGRFCVEIPLERSRLLRLWPWCQELGAAPFCTALLGADAVGEPLLLKLNAPDVVHVLLAGATGSGKTALARALLASLAYYNPVSQLHLILIDPKRRGFAPLAQLPHAVHGVIDSTEDAIDHLCNLVAEMERRDRTGANQPALIVAIDELADLMQTAAKRVEPLLTRLAQRGRQAGIHLVACTQKPSASLIGSAIKANFPVRLVGAVASRDEARYAAGISDSGAEKLMGRGDFLLIKQGEPLRFQAAWLGAKELEKIVQATRGGVGAGLGERELSSARRLIPKP